MSDLEKVPTNFCCEMRKKFLVGIIGVDVSVPLPTDAVDCVLDWGDPDKGKPLLLAIAYCPFCGKKLKFGETLRDSRPTPDDEEEDDEYLEWEE